MLRNHRLEGQHRGYRHHQHRQRRDRGHAALPPVLLALLQPIQAQPGIPAIS
jgi:hypothetical protein